MRSGVRKKWDDLNNSLESVYRRYVARKNAKTRLKRMNGGYKCDKEYREIVLPYWKKYGYKPKKYWYEIFWDRDHKPDPRYIPDDLWYGTIVPYFSNTQFRRFGEDKCLHSVWFKDMKRPRTIAMNIAGVYYSSEYEPISRDEAMELCLKEKELFVKPSIDSGEARLIKFFSGQELNRENLEEAFSALSANFVVQENIKQHPVIAAFNESSLNTIRVVSFFFNNEVHILSTILRVGASGSKVDNIGAGGYACVIKPDGSLSKSGVNRKAEWVEKTANGTRFDGVSIPSFDSVIEAVKREHKKLAHFKLIGWDIGVDTEGDPVFIEFNTCPGSNQITCGPTFGDLTDDVLDEIFIKKTLKDSQN